jgi:predicted ester cyclase
MSLKEFKAKYRRAAEEAYHKGNVDILDELNMPDVIIHQPPFPDIKGLSEYKQSVLAARRAFTDIHFDWEEMIGEGNVMAFRASWHMKHTGVSPKIPISPSGKEIVMKAGLFIDLKNGKIAEVFEYKDYLGLLKQLGVMP